MSRRPPGADPGSTTDWLLPVLAGVVGAATPGLGRGVSLGLGTYGAIQDTKERKRYRDMVEARERQQLEEQERYLAGTKGVKKDIAGLGSLKTDNQGNILPDMPPQSAQRLSDIFGTPNVSGATMDDVPKPLVDPQIARVAHGFASAGDINRASQLIQPSLEAAQAPLLPKIADVRGLPEPRSGESIEVTTREGYRYKREGQEAPAPEKDEIRVVHGHGLAKGVSLRTGKEIWRVRVPVAPDTPKEYRVNTVDLGMRAAGLEVKGLEHITPQQAKAALKEYRPDADSLLGVLLGGGQPQQQPQAPKLNPGAASYLSGQ